MKTTRIAAAIAALFAATAYAGAGHDHAAAPFNFELLAANDTADAWRRWAEDFSNEMRTSMGTMFSTRVDSSRVVKNAPYSAEVITENNQPLADGNVISKRTSGKVYRDAAGRTRQESGGDGKQPAIYINDPVASQRIILSPGSKRAVITPRTFTAAHSHANVERREKSVIRINGQELRVEDGKAFLDGKEITGTKEIKVGGKEIRIEGDRITVDGKEMGGNKRVTTKTVTGVDGTTREEVRVQILSGDDGNKQLFVMPVPPVPPVPPSPITGHVHPIPPVPPVPPLPAMNWEGFAKMGKGVTTSMGSKDFDGVRAEGKKTTWTIPAGEIGNRSPIEVTSESWYSPDLQLTVYSRYNDPRKGESIYRLAGIKRSEPSADLFRVPEGYEAMSKDVERERARKEREKERQMQNLERDQQRLQREQERIQKETERLKRERERLQG